MNLTNNYGLPESIVNAIMQDPYDGPQNDLSSISVTTLISPPKMRMLKARHAGEIEEDVSDQIWKLLGSSVHSMIERAETKDALIEERLTMKVGDKTISGKTDIYHDGCIQDYKVTSAWAVVFSPEGKKEWTQQLNCLALLYRNAGFEVNKLQIIAILRDWSKTNSLKDANYPQIPIVVIDVPLWTVDQQQQFVKDKATLHSMYEDVSDDQIPECSPEDRWQSATKYAVMKNANKRADKVFEDHSEALNYMNEQDKKHSWRVEERPGVDKRCAEYCSVSQFCHYWKAMGQGKVLEMEI